MMKPVTKFFTLTLITLTFPGVAFAMPLDLMTNFQALKTTSIANLSESLKVSNKEAFCGAIEGTKNKLSAAVATKEESVSRYLDELAQHLEDERNSRDAKLGEARSVADQARSEWQAQLENRAKNDDQEDAVAKYQTAVEAAIEKRREGVDQAIVDFRKSVDALALKRSTGMRSARDSFKASFEAVTKKLEMDCTNGVTTDTLVKDFKAGLKAAQDKLAADKKSAAALQAELKVLAEARKKSIAGAVVEFQSEINRANQDLQASFMGGE